jgi:hypothetical protein
VQNKSLHASLLCFLHHMLLAMFTVHSPVTWPYSLTRVSKICFASTATVDLTVEIARILHTVFLTPYLILSYFSIFLGSCKLSCISAQVFPMGTSLLSVSILLSLLTHPHDAYRRSRTATNNFSHFEVSKAFFPFLLLSY